MATEKSIELFLEISLPESKTLRLNQGLFRLPFRLNLNNVIRLPGFFRFSSIPNGSGGDISYCIASSLR